MACETFAFIYDEVMDETLYQQWLAFSKRHLQEDTKIFLELACGTGALAVAFAKDGYKVTGLDLSEEMLMIASQRAYEEDASIQFRKAICSIYQKSDNIRQLPVFLDSLCYMKNRQEVQQVFDEVYQALEENGRFLFDVHSTYQVDEVFPEYSYHYQGIILLLWDSYQEARNTASNIFLTFSLKNKKGLVDLFVKMNYIKSVPIHWKVI